MTQIPEDELNQILREAGIEYPLGLRGVRDLVNQRDGHLEAALEAKEPKPVQHRMLPGSHERGGAECVCGEEWSRWNDMCARQGAEQAEQTLANVREMVRRLRHAEPLGSATPGYVLRRIESVLDGEVLDGEVPAK